MLSATTGAPAKRYGFERKNPTTIFLISTNNQQRTTNNQTKKTLGVRPSKVRGAELPETKKSRPKVCFLIRLQRKAALDSHLYLKISFRTVLFLAPVIFRI